MHPVRRLYLYVVSFISLEIILWGAINLARSTASGSALLDDPDRLAQGLSLILVGLPVFGLHWWLIQRSVRLEAEERTARLRAVFLYGTLLATLLPAVQNGLALLDRLLTGMFGLDPRQAVLGGVQSGVNNLLAIVLNLAAAGYFFSVLHKDWQAGAQSSEVEERREFTAGSDLGATRRLYRYLWLVYGLGLAVYGSQQILQFALQTANTPVSGRLPAFTSGLALLLIGAPLWLFVSRLIQSSLAEPAEQQSVLRLAVLYGIVFSSVVGVLASVGLVLEVALRAVLGESLALGEFLEQVSRPVSLAVPLGAAWLVYGRMLGAEMRTIAGSPSGRRAEPVEASALAPTIPSGASARTAEVRSAAQRAGLRRLYFYVLAFVGLAVVLVGLHQFLAFLIDTATGPDLAGRELRSRLASALALLLVGLPVWLVSWRLMLQEAAREVEAGDRARRSVVRRSYLYLVLFAGVMGVMLGTGSMLYQILQATLGEVPNNLGRELLHQLARLLLFTLLLVYHAVVLRSDGQRAGRSLARRHAQFPALILSPDEPAGDPQDRPAAYGEFAVSLANALHRQAPALPVAVHPYSLGAPDEMLSAARVVILPAELLDRPSEALRLWLQAFPGTRLVVPTPARGWHWVYGSGRPLSLLARQTAQAVRQLAEGEEISPAREASSWMLLVYILAGLFALQLLLVALIAAGSLFFS